MQTAQLQSLYLVAWLFAEGCYVWAGTEVNTQSLQQGLYASAVQWLTSASMDLVKYTKDKTCKTLTTAKELQTLRRCI